MVREAVVGARAVMVGQAAAERLATSVRLVVEEWQKVDRLATSVQAVRPTRFVCLTNGPEPGPGLQACDLEEGVYPIIDPDDDFDSSAPTGTDINLGTMPGEPTRTTLTFRDLALAPGETPQSVHLLVHSSGNYPFDETDEGPDIVVIRAMLAPVEDDDEPPAEQLTNAQIACPDSQSRPNEHGRSARRWSGAC